MKHKLSQKITYWLGVVAIGLVVGVSLQFVQAWTEPTVAPPGGNVGAPLNTSGVGQIKEGGLLVRNVPATPLSPNGLIVRYGNVGIGTAIPGGVLDIYKSGTDNYPIMFRTTYYDTDTGPATTLNWQVTPAGFYYKSGITGSGSSFTIIDQDSATDRYALQVFGSGGSNNLLSITSAGNVGIGKEDPQKKLHIYVNGDNYLLVESGGVGTASQIEFDRGGSNVSWVGVANDNTLDLWTLENIPILFGINDSEKMRIDTNGNVGIGTTNPGSFKLYVAGKARADTPLASDSDDTVATKGYVDAQSSGGGCYTKIATYTSSSSNTECTTYPSYPSCAAGFNQEDTFQYQEGTGKPSSGFNTRTCASAIVCCK